MSRTSLCVTAASGAILAGILTVPFLTRADAAPDDKGKDAALERTRRQVRMLDHIYKTTIVLITDKYVHDEEDFPAGSAAVALFDSVTKEGFHDVRLIDATGRPRRRKNAPREGFEETGVAALKAGRDYYEEVVEKGGDQRVLNAVTAVPVVSEKCIMCHSHYEDVPEGAAIGAISYQLEVE